MAMKFKVGDLVTEGAHDAIWQVITFEEFKRHFPNAEKKDHALRIKCVVPKHYFKKGDVCQDYFTCNYIKVIHYKRILKELL